MTVSAKRALAEGAGFFGPPCGSGCQSGFKFHATRASDATRYAFRTGTKILARIGLIRSVGRLRGEPHSFH